jgi:hypothetical protein
MVMRKRVLPLFVSLGGHINGPAVTRPRQFEPNANHGGSEVPPLGNPSPPHAIAPQVAFRRGE